MFNKEEIRAILFDMDGTLVDTEPVGSETFKNFLKNLNISISKDEWTLFDKVWRRDGTKISFEEFVATILKKYSPGSNIEENILNFYTKYEENILLSAPLPGADHLLSYLRGKYKTALVTASTTSQAEAIIKNNGWNDFFDVVISHDNFEKSKPNPECFLKAAEKLTIIPKECVVIEDSKNGTLSGKNAGMIVIGVRAGNKHPQDLSAAILIVNTLEDLISLL